MTNWEKYKDELFEFIDRCSILAVDLNNRPVKCADLKCVNCLLNGKCADREYIKEWLNSEYVEPSVDWTKVEVDTKILVRDREDRKWYKRYFAKYENGTVYAFMDGRTSWSAEDADCVLDCDYANLAEVD